jgi:hypothetical protein
MRIYPPFLSKARNSGRVEPQRGEGLGEFSIANRLSCVGVLLRKTVKLFLTHLLRIRQRFTESSGRGSIPVMDKRASP